MITKELEDFIKKEKSLGKGSEQIQNELLSQGWTASDLKEAFEHLNLNNQGQIQVSPVVKSKKPLHPVFMIILLLVITGGVSAHYFQDELAKLPILDKFFQVQRTSPQATIEANLPETQTQPEEQTNNSVASSVLEKKNDTLPLPKLDDYAVKIISPSPDTKVSFGQSITVKIAAGSKVNYLESVSLGLDMPASLSDLQKFSEYKKSSDGVFTVDYKISDPQEEMFGGTQYLYVKTSPFKLGSSVRPSDVSADIQNWKLGSDSVPLILDYPAKPVSLDVNPDPLKVKVGGKNINGMYMPTAPVVDVNYEDKKQMIIFGLSLLTYKVENPDIISVVETSDIKLYSDQNRVPLTSVLDIKALKVGTTKISFFYKGLTKTINVITE